MRIAPFFFDRRLMWKKTLGLDGVMYDSQSEATVANWLLVSGIDYEPHKELPKPSRGKTDFYLPQYDLWVEYDGLMEVRRGNGLNRKEAFYRKMGLKFLTITRNEWQRDLLDRIASGE